MNIAIKVENLHKDMGPNPALKGVTLFLKPGLLHGLIGPEGSGKTTLLRHLIGLLKADRGHVTYLQDGKSVPLAAIRPQMAYMPQLQSLYPDLSIGEHLDFFAELYQIPKKVYRQRRAELLSITRLGPLLFVTRELGTCMPASIHKPPADSVKSIPFSLLVIPIA